MSGFETVCEWLGRAVVSGELPAGAAIGADDVADRTGVARTVVREAARVVEGLGLVSPRQRVGLVAQPPEAWAVLDPRVIRWRLSVGDRATQVRELAELRLAIEPLAASLAARRASPEEANSLFEIASAMDAALPREERIRLDQSFHLQLVAAARNGMLSRAAAPISEALEEHSTHGAGREPSAHELSLHVDLAEAIRDRRPDDASRLALRIVAGPAEEHGPVPGRTALSLVP